MNTVVRPAAPSDAPWLYRAWQSLRQYNQSMDPRIRPSPVSETEFAVGLQQLVARPTAVTFVAEAGGKRVGFGSVTIQANQPDRLPERLATVGYLYVDPSMRRGGIGRKLFDAIATWAAAQDGVSHIEMPVLANDDEASAFWTALGFTPFIQRLWAPLGPAED